MAGEIIKTKGVVLAIHPWSRTSHIVTWLTPDHGCVATLVKGAVRPKSAFLGQYDLFYTCDLLYYARARAELHALRETTPANMRTSLRGRWRETALAGYAAGLMKDLAPANGESKAWFEFFSAFLDRLASAADVSVRHPTSEPPRNAPLAMLKELVWLEMGLLKLAGWAPDFSGMDMAASHTPFAIDLGRCGEGARTVRLAPGTVRALMRPDARSHGLETVEDAVRFLGVFLAYHIDTQPDVRRSLVTMLASSLPPACSR